MRVLVTGGAGYICSVLVEELLRDGHAVWVYDSLYKGHSAAIAPEAAFVQADLRDGAALRTALREAEIEAVIHMAADSLVGESVVDPAKYYQNNIVTSLGLLDALRECGVERLAILYPADASSVAATGPWEQVVSHTPPNP